MPWTGPPLKRRINCWSSASWAEATAGVGGLFFRPGRDVGAGLVDDVLGVLFHELLILLVA